MSEPKTNRPVPGQVWKPKTRTWPREVIDVRSGARGGQYAASYRVFFRRGMSMVRSEWELWLKKTGATC